MNHFFTRKHLFLALAIMPFMGGVVAFGIAPNTRTETLTRETVVESVELPQVQATDSGTFDFFTETVVQKPQKIEKLDEAKALVLAASNLQTSEDDNTLVQGVEGSPYAIGYFGFAYFKDQAEKLNAVSLNDVVPSFETAEDGSYKLSRPLFLYSDAEIIKAKPQVGAFINFYLTRVNDVIGEVGYFPASDAALDEARTKLADILK